MSRSAKLAALTICIFASIALAGLAGARINSTKSLARGLYWRVSAPIERGAYVRFCPPDRDVFREARRRHYVPAGFCPGGLAFMMKRIAAMPGDVVTVDEAGVIVNGERLPFSAPKAMDSNGRPLPRWNAHDYTLRAGELLLMTDMSVDSFDARYFGPLAQSQVVDVVRPVMTLQ